MSNLEQLIIRNREEKEQRAPHEQDEVNMTPEGEHTDAEHERKQPPKPEPGDIRDILITKSKGGEPVDPPVGDRFDHLE